MSLNLSDYFSGIGAKRLSMVETSPRNSNQHEFNGINEFKSFFGSERKSFTGTFIYLNDDPDKIISENAKLTWYDARESHPTRTEYRLYYSTNSVINSSNINDLLIIGRTEEKELVVIVAPKGSTSERQMTWLFRLNEVGTRFVFKNYDRDDIVLEYSGRYVLSTLGFETDRSSDSFLNLILEKFGDKFPSTREFSSFARSTLNDVSPIEEPDLTIVKWLEREEVLFKTLEKHIVSKRLSEGFGSNGEDVDAFISYSLSVQNRRKSRAGHSFENHLAEIFSANEIRYSKGMKTERNNKPDFLFPGIDDYRNEYFNSSLLTMLGVKTSAKDRWRQILTEAERVPQKHLATLEPAISENQTLEMQENNLQLVIPSTIIETYSDSQKSQIINFEDFLKFLKANQLKI